MRLNGHIVSYRSWLFLPLALLLLSRATFAQGDAFQFNHLTTIDGLSQTSVIAIEQDSLGQMWLGTRDGLNKYDGSTFTIYRNDPNDSTSISNSDILSIKEDGDGSIWVGTYNGLNRHDPRKEVFKRYRHSNTTPSLSNNTVWSIAILENGAVWAGTSQGISVYDRAGDRFNTLDGTTGNTSKLPSDFVTRIVQFEKGTIWVGTSEGLCRLTKDTKGGYTFKAFLPELPGNMIFVQDILECAPGILCLATKKNGTIKFDTTLEKFMPYTESNRDGDQKEDVRAMVLDAEGRLWQGTSEGIRIAERPGVSLKVSNDPDNPKSLSNNYVKSIFTDAKGSVWIGSYYGGVDIWDPSNAHFLSLGGASASGNLDNTVVSSMVKTDAGLLIFGTEGAGLSLFDQAKNSFTKIHSKNHPALKSDNIKSLHLDKNKLWIGSFDEGLFVYDLRKKAFIQSPLRRGLLDYIDDTGVYAIRAGQEGNLLIGTFGKGLIGYDPGTGKMKFFNTGVGGHPSFLTNDRVRSLLVDSEENLWVGTQSGLSLLRNKNGDYSVETATHYFYNEQTQSGDDILTLFQDGRGTIWAGIRAKGLYKYTGDGFEQVLVDSKNTVTSIYAILEDASNDLWMSSNQGIINYDPVAQKAVVYDGEDGLTGNEFSSSAALRVGPSQFYYGGTSGVATFSTAGFAKNTHAPQVLLTGLTIKNEKIGPSKKDGILEKGIAYTHAITLPHDQANFTLDFAIPSFINPNNNSYKYRMVGLEDNWNETRSPKASYIIQNAGNYTFEVMGANNDGVWNARPTILHIKVRPAPWRSAWAFLGYALLIVAAISGLVLIIRAQGKLRYQLEMEYFENERNQEAHGAKLQFFTNISHEFRTPLTLIAGPLQQILENYKGSTHMYKKLLVMESNANHLLQLINRLMDFRKLEDNQIKLEAAKGNVVKFLREIFVSFTEYAKDGGYTYTFDTVLEDVQLYYDRPKLEQVFYNLISNAFRYTEKKGGIVLRVLEDEGCIHVEVEDSGEGIPPEYWDKIFDRFFEVPAPLEKKQSYNTGSGIGLSIAKNIVELHKGRLTLRPKDDRGSIFRVTLPLGREHLKPDEIARDFKFSDDLSLYVPQGNASREALGLRMNGLLPDREKDTILLVEDNMPLRGFMRDLLQAQFNILEAGDGAEGLEMALLRSPDLIISDVIMPKMVGTTLCAKIKENVKTSHIPVILLTSRTSLVYKLEGLEKGADDYISKPFDLDEFRLRVNNLLQSTKRLKEKFESRSVFHAAELTISSLDEELLQKAFKVVGENMSNEHFDIPTFSTELGVSRTLLFTKIKAWTNGTPNGFIREIRLKHAAGLLEQGNYTIAQISSAVGFKNAKYFSKIFQKKYGESPTAFVNRYFDQLRD